MSDQKEKKGFVIWLTGLSGSGKSTLADQVYDSIAANGNRVEKLDGDVMRGVFPATGFSKEERDAHIKRVGFIASLLEKHDVIVVASFISPYSKMRRLVRDMCSNFVEVFVSTSIDECEKRDVKGLYKRARAGEIKDFTGIDAPYEKPQNAEIVVDTEKQQLDESLAQVMEYIKQYM